MSEQSVARALESDAPLTAAVHQRDVAHEVAEERGWHEAALVGRTVTINRPRAELYAFWRDFRNLALFMENVERVTPGDDERSHWVVKAPAGKTVEWDSVLTEEVENEVLAWEFRRGRRHQERRPHRVQGRPARARHRGHRDHRLRAAWRRPGQADRQALPEGAEDSGPA
ncbi:SRPBCC family protein [Caulobacter sp. UC70_42]|uniref:SRPBCC family protein n=1 Tax=Caulobacter sp. UC70_42 TaxID=3374551 RepID=UPI00375682AC